MGTAYSALQKIAVGLTKRPEYVAFVSHFLPLSLKKQLILIRFEVAAY
jgi:hypothetical protein